MRATTIDMRRLRYAQRKGFTLIELILAIAITAILATNAGYLISSAVHVRQLAQTREELMQVSMRLHYAITGELSAASQATVYTTNILNFGGLDDDEHILYCRTYTVYESEGETEGESGEYYGALALGSNSDSTASFMPGSDGFDYYDGAVLKDEVTEGGGVVNPAFRLRLVGVSDYKYIGDKDPSTCYRCLEITTTLFKNNRYYTHTSTVRLNELALYAQQDISTGDVYVGTAAPSLLGRRVPESTDLTTDFVAIVFKNKGTV